MKKFIALLTDFGQKDHYVGVMKGVIASIAPLATVIDLCHEVPPQDIRSAAWLLSQSYCYYPVGTIFTCIVDPGVGSERLPILLKTDKYSFIAPDNGLLTYILEKEDCTQVINLDNKEMWLSNVSNTFHGRDIFSPVAAHLADGKPLEMLGSSADWTNLIKIPIKQPKIEKNKITGNVHYIDHFGNLITNIEKNMLIKTDFLTKINNNTILELKKYYACGKKDEIIALIGSHGFLEVSVVGSNAAKRLDASLDDEVILQL